MAHNLVPIGDEFQVNLLDPLPRSLTPHENGLIGVQGPQAIAALENGDFAVVYQNDAGGSGDLDIMSVEFTPTGHVVGAPFRVDFDAGNQSAAAVATEIGGGYVAVWQDEVATRSIHLAVITASTPTNPTEFTVADPTENLNSPSIGTFANGTHIVTYTLNGTSSDDIYFSIVNAAGTANLVDNVGLITTISLDEDDAKVAVSGNLAAVVYKQGDFSSDILLSIVNTAGNGVDFETVADITGAAVLPDVATLSDGRFVIVWSNLGASADVWGRVLTRRPATSRPRPFKSRPPPTTSSWHTLLDCLMAASWSHGPIFPNSMSGGIVHARRFDASGAPAGDAFQIGENNSELAGVAASRDGHVFAAWITESHAHTTDPDIGIDGQIFQPMTETVNGTKHNDTLITYGLSEPINGLAGNDKIRAGAGNDVLNGGKGNDILTGGPGLDAFVFNVVLENENADRITDFAHGFDKIVLDHTVFTELKVGHLASKAFFSGPHANEGKDATDHVVYDSKSGHLWYDADGAGGADAKLIATLVGSPDHLRPLDFLVVT